VPADRSENGGVRNLRFIGLAVPFIALVGCAAPADLEPGASSARLILDPLMTRRNPAAGILTVRREAAVLDEACRHRIFLDGNPVADLRPNEVLTIYAPPGQHVLRAEQTGWSCHAGNEIAATSEPGKGHTFLTAAPSASGALLTSTTE
jgi:hypothetical protein